MVNFDRHRTFLQGYHHFLILKHQDFKKRRKCCQEEILLLRTVLKQNKLKMSHLWFLFIQNKTLQKEVYQLTQNLDELELNIERMNNNKVWGREFRII